MTNLRELPFFRLLQISIFVFPPLLFFSGRFLILGGVFSTLYGVPSFAGPQASASLGMELSSIVNFIADTVNESINHSTERGIPRRIVLRRVMMRGEVFTSDESEAIELALPESRAEAVRPSEDFANEDPSALEEMNKVDEASSMQL